MNILHIDSSITGDASASRAISAAVVERLRSEDRGAEIVTRDLAAAPLAHLTLDAFAGAEAQQVLEEFLDADIVVIGAGLYNFSIPSQLKAWIDRLVVAGRTFSYSETGPVGLIKGKRMIVALARGNVYHAGSRVAAFEHAETLLRHIFGLIGVEPEFIIADGMKISEESGRAALASAIEQAKAVTVERIAA